MTRRLSHAKSRRCFKCSRINIRFGFRGLDLLCDTASQCSVLFATEFVCFQRIEVPLRRERLGEGRVL